MTLDVKEFYPAGPFANLNKHASFGSGPQYMVCIAKGIAECILECQFIIVGGEIYWVLRGSGIGIPLSNSLANRQNCY